MADTPAAGAAPETPAVGASAAPAPQGPTPEQILAEALAGARKDFERQLEEG